MIFLFTGEEKFLLDKQLSTWKDAFIKKYWENNLYIFQEDNFNAENIASALAGWWLFDDKKFIIIKWIPKDSFQKVPNSEYLKLEDFITEHIDNLPEDNVIVFVSYKPDKRTKFYKFLSKNSNIQTKEFKLLNEKQLLAYLTDSYPISLSDANYLIEKVWTNLMLLNNELQKILKISNKIDQRLIDKYVVQNVEQDAFKLLDNLSNKKFLKILSNLEESKEDFFKILWLLYWNLKNIILILEQKKKGESAKWIASKLSLHPFVVNKIYKSKYDFNLIKLLFSELVNLDFNIKNWKIDVNLAYLYLKRALLKLNN